MAEQYWLEHGWAVRSSTWVRFVAPEAKLDLEREYYSDRKEVDRKSDALLRIIWEEGVRFSSLQVRSRYFSYHGAGRTPILQPGSRWIARVIGGPNEGTGPWEGKEGMVLFFFDPPDPNRGKEEVEAYIQLHYGHYWASWELKEF